MIRGEQMSGPEMREMKPAAVSASIESRASSEHPDRNEDAALGDVSRIDHERATPPALDTKDPNADLAAIREAGGKEAAAAEALRERNVYGLFDGVSGREGRGYGIIGSRIAAGAIAETMAAIPPDADAEQSRQWIERAFEAATGAVMEYQRSRADLEEIATTADIVRMVDNGDGTFDVAYGHAGDSRIYVFDGETKKLRAETIDDSMAGEDFRKGNITRERYDQIVNAKSVNDVLPKDRILFQNRNVVYKMIGLEKNEKPTTGVFRVKKGDKILMTSDGVHDNLTDEQIEEILASGGDIQELIFAAGRVAEGDTDRAKPDDITGALVELGR